MFGVGRGCGMFFLARKRADRCLITDKQILLRLLLAALFTLAATSTGLAQSGDPTGCDARKFTATMGVTRHLSRCVGREQRGSATSRSCTAQIARRFEHVIERIEAHGGCSRKGDASVLVEIATRFVEDLERTSFAKGPGVATPTAAPSPQPSSSSQKPTDPEISATPASPAAGATPQPEITPQRPHKP